MNWIKVLKVGVKFKNTNRIFNGEDLVRKQLALSQVCRQIYNDITDEGTLSASDTSLMNSFFATIKPYHMGYISYVKLEFRIMRRSYNFQSKCFAILAGCKSLKELSIHASFNFYICTRKLGEWEIPDNALNVFKKYEGIKKVRGLKNSNLLSLFICRGPAWERTICCCFGSTAVSLHPMQIYGILHYMMS